MDGSDRLDVELRADGREALVVVRGEIDGATAPQLADYLDLVGTTSVALDLSGVDFMSAAGVSVILDGRRRGRHVRVAEASPAVRRILELSGTEELLAGDAEEWRAT